MEFASVKRSRNRRKKRNVRKRRRERMKFEVRSVKRRRFATECGYYSVDKEKVIANAMQADAFWKNYVAAQEWQKRHSVTWWRSRCIALEHENEMLRNEIRLLSGQSEERISSRRWQNVRKENNLHGDGEKLGFNKELPAVVPEKEEDLEFHVDADMMSFLEQSIRHKMELKQKRELELAVSKEESVIPVESGAAWARARSEGAKLLYGDASPTILGMETALQATVDRHKDKSKPRYWPNIPFRL